MIHTIVPPDPLPQCSIEGPPERNNAPHGRVVAIWGYGPVLEPDYLCKPCLDESLDFADRSGVEPVRLDWVMRLSDRWCGKHLWPAVLCRDWSHGPGYNAFGQPDSVTLAVRRSMLRTRGPAQVIGIERWRVGEVPLPIITPGPSAPWAGA
jgi:hypothetical protein